MAEFDKDQVIGFPNRIPEQELAGVVRYPWAQLWDWRETERVGIVMPTPRNFYVIPKRDVDPMIVERMRGHLGNARKRVAGG